MQIMKKLIVITFTLLFVVSIVPQKVNAIDTTSIMNGADKFLEKANDENVANLAIFDADKEKKGIDQLYYFMLTIGIIIAIFVGTVLGIQFITSGSVGKAKVKEKAIPFVLGAIVVFGAFGIWKLVYNILNGFFN